MSCQKDRLLHGNHSITVQNENLHIWNLSKKQVVNDSGWIWCKEYDAVFASAW